MKLTVEIEVWWRGVVDDVMVDGSEEPGRSWLVVYSEPVVCW